MMNDGVTTQARARRRRRGWTQAEAAGAAGVSLRTYQMFETGRTIPQGGNLRAILAALDMDADADGAGEQTRTDWPMDIQVFLDVMGAYLATLPGVERLDVIHSLTRQVFSARH